MTSETPPGVKPYRIVVGIDYADTGDAALHEALRIHTGRDGTELHLVHVLKPAVGTSLRSGAMDALLDELEKEPAKLRAYIEKRSPDMHDAGEVTLKMHVRAGSPEEAIEQLAVDVDADLIVVGTHHREGLARLTVGNTAEALLRIAHTPVLVVRPKDPTYVPEKAAIEPLCPDCAKAREASNGQQLWCEYHGRPRPMRHGYMSSEVFHFGSRRAGI